MSIYNNGNYLHNNSDWHVSDSSWKAAQINKIIKKNKLNPYSVCEIGCGAGEILRQLSIKEKYKSTKFYGYETSEDAYKLCLARETNNLSFLKSDLTKINKHFDLLLCIDVFEHVKNYMEFVSSLKDKAYYKIFHIPLDLSVNSLLRRTLINARNTVGHLHHFTPETALATLKDCNYEIIDQMYTPTFIGSKAKSLKTKIAKIPRYILYKISPKITSTLLGGVSLMVLTK
jgi:SAM-dependent methyltransferase